MIKKNRSIIFLSLFIIFFFLQTLAHAIDIVPKDGICGPDEESSKECTDVLTNSEANHTQPAIKEKVSKSSRLPKKDEKVKTETANENKKAEAQKQEFIVYFFWGKGCPHCEEEKAFLNEMKKKYPDMKVIDYEVWYDQQNAELLIKMANSYKMKASGVPVTFIDDNVFIGFSKNSREEISESFQKCISSQCVDPGIILSGKISIDTIRKLRKSEEAPESTDNLECTEKSKTVYIPWLGNLNASEMSLPAITIVIAGLDSFNPCAFFVLLSLLGLLIHAQSRKKMFLVGSIFVFFSGFVYFIFMAAWLNLFLVMGQVEIMTKIAASIAIVIAAINIKDFFVFKKGISLTIPDNAKPKLFDRMRKLMKSTSLFSILVGTVVLAIAANSYELLCTAGFPMVFTRILTLNNLTTMSYYMYLVLYNLIYVIPLSIIVVIFTITLGKKNLTEWQGRLMKLISGTMMLGLGGVLIFNPAVLSNAFISFLILSGAFVVSVIIAFLTKKFGYS